MMRGILVCLSLGLGACSSSTQPVADAGSVRIVQHPIGACYQDIGILLTVERQFETLYGWRGYVARAYGLNGKMLDESDPVEFSENITCVRRNGETRIYFGNHLVDSLRYVPFDGQTFGRSKHLGWDLMGVSWTQVRSLGDSVLFAVGRSPSPEQWEAGDLRFVQDSTHILAGIDTGFLQGYLEWTLDNNFDLTALHTVAAEALDDPASIIVSTPDFYTEGTIVDLGSRYVITYDFEREQVRSCHVAKQECTVWTDLKPVSMVRSDDQEGYVMAYMIDNVSNAYVLTPSGGHVEIEPHVYGDPYTCGDSTVVVGQVYPPDGDERYLSTIVRGDTVRYARTSLVSAIKDYRYLYRTYATGDSTYTMTITPKSAC